jgi:hypothetical protein
VADASGRRSAVPPVGTAAATTLATWVRSAHGKQGRDIACGIGENLGVVGIACRCAQLDQDWQSET